MCFYLFKKTIKKICLIKDWFYFYFIFYFFLSLNIDFSKKFYNKIYNLDKSLSDILLEMIIGFTINENLIYENKDPQKDFINDFSKLIDH